ncbi:MAG TPA: amidohydrolase family protein [Dehalococcoidia bacterium]|nr:amidohydrolase family protein [Dehalococcoidia bacterium]
MTQQTHGRIDVHAHHMPAAYRAAIVDQGIDTDGNPNIPEWSVDAALGFMERNDIATSLLSISSPGVHWGDDAAARDMARLCNETAAQAKRDHPRRFGSFASLPLPDVDGALREIEYAFETLDADGIGLMTNFRGKYLGDPDFAPVFDELNRRNAIVFIHPTSPPCHEAISMGYPRPMIEFPFDTTRTVTNLVYSGTLDRCPNIRFILPHAGGTLPFLVARIGPGRSGRPEPVKEPFDAYLRRLYYDTAGAPSAHSFASLLQLVDVRQVLYGSDWAWAPEPTAAAQQGALAANPLLSDADRERIYRLNTVELFPRLA